MVSTIAPQGAAQRFACSTLFRPDGCAAPRFAVRNGLTGAPRVEGASPMTLIRQPNGTYRIPRSRTTIAEASILAAAEEILKTRLERLGSIARPADAIDFFRARIGHLPHEEFHVLWLDNRHRALGADRLFNGTLDGTAVYAREVVRRALQINAAAAVIAHNHPSGVAEPSDSDRRISVELREALSLVGVRILDHLVVGAGASVSMAERGQL